MKFLKAEPVVSIMPEVLNKIKKYTKLCEHSIYWLGKVTRVDNEYFIEDVAIIPQTVGKSGTIDFEKFSDFEFLIENEGYEPFCLGRTKKGKSVVMTNSDIEFINALTGEVGYMIYIQTNTKNETSVNVIDYDRGIIFDNVQLTVTDTEFFTDEDVLAEISENIIVPTGKKDSAFSNKHKSFKDVESYSRIVDTDKESKIVDLRKDTKETTKLPAVKEVKVEYVPNEFVKENIDFRLLVAPKGGDVVNES